MLYRYSTIADTYRHCEKALGEAERMRLPAKHKWLAVTECRSNTVAELHFDGRNVGPNPALTGKMNRLCSVLVQAMGRT